MSEPYWTDGQVSLYLGDCREILPALGVAADCIVADPPYGETSLAWDRWPDGWLETAAAASRSLWCFGSLRMYLERRDEFGRWKLSQDVVWHKTQGTSMVADRFVRVHELPTHWYRGEWRTIYHDVPRDAWYGPTAATTTHGQNRDSHLGAIGYAGQGYVETGTRLAQSVIKCRNMFRRSIHPTEKPLGVLDPLIHYACPPGGLVVDPFAGSGSTMDAARCSGRRAIGIEADEKHIELAARRLSQAVLEVS